MMIKIGIHETLGRKDFSKEWCKTLIEQGVQVETINLLASDALEKAKTFDGIMWHWFHNPSDNQSAPHILRVIEKELHIPVFPDINTSWHFDNKIAQYYLFKSLNLPTPETWLFWDKDLALEWSYTAIYPLVFKLSTGASSANVILVEDQQEASLLIDLCFRGGIWSNQIGLYEKKPKLPHSMNDLRIFWYRLNHAFQYLFNRTYPPLPQPYWKPEYGYIYFQEFLPDNKFDTRITVIGDRAFGFSRINRKDDFRASGGGNIDYQLDKIDLRCVEIAFNTSKQCKFQSMAYDFLFKNNQPVIGEISYGYADWAIHDCHGHWNSNLEWIEGHMWPQTAHIEDFLNRIKS